MSTEALYDWLFHYNSYKETWAAFRREDKEKYFNGELDESKYHRSSKVTTLIEFICKNKN